MAAGSARYVRYILFSCFVRLNPPYAALHASLGLRPAARCLEALPKELGVFDLVCPADRLSEQVLAIFYFVSHSSYNGAVLRPDGYAAAGRSGLNNDKASQPNMPANEPAKQETLTKTPAANKADPAVSKTPSKPLTPAKDGGAEHPMAMMPGQPEWEDLVSIAPGPRMNATFVTLARNSDVWEIADSIRQVEDRFNKRYNYDWVFLNDQPFDDTFKTVTTSLCSGKTHYGLIPKEHWSFPEWIDKDKAAKVREDMKQRKIIYGDSVSYRHMCRFESGFFFRQELMLNYEYYWRVEPSIKLYCDIHYDPFRFMHENKKKYSFVLSLYEYIETIPTLWETTKKFMKAHPEHIAEGNTMGFLSDDGGETYNKCHFVSPLLRGLPFSPLPSIVC